MSDKTVKCNDVFEWLICNINKIAVSDAYGHETSDRMSEIFDDILEEIHEEELFMSRWAGDLQ